MKNKILSVAFVVILIIIANSCNDYLDVNYDPSFPQSAESYSILPPVLGQMVRGDSWDARYAGKYVQNIVQNTKNYTFDLHGYFAGSDAAGEKWRSHYWSIGKNIDLMIERSTAKEQWDYVGVAKAIRAWSWQSSTDVYGEMILTQAWEPNRYVFDYDTQDKIYEEVVRLSKEALTDLARTDGNVNTASLGRGDLVYKGDRAKWIKFIYANLARNVHHLSNKSTYNPDKVIEYVDKSFTSNADNFNVPHSGTISNDGNFFGPLRNNMGLFRASNYFLNLLNGLIFNGVSDPRLPLMYSACPDGVYRGADPGLGDPNDKAGNTMRLPNLWGVDPGAFNASTTVGKYIFTNKADHPIITYFELQFIKAEAAFKKGDKALAYEAFKKGVEAHMDFTKVAVADKASYMASAAVPQSATALTLNDIMLQKYIALWVHGALETWVDMRRYDYSNSVYTGFTLPNPLFIDNNGKPAYRFRPRYNSEYVWNLEALKKIGGDLPDFHTKKPWFLEK
jgi:hypothetical protein